MRFSIITVCYNAEKTIESTICSVLNQTFEDYEYIIIDGASTDRTLDIIHNHCDGIEKVRIISEPDFGLYDAMNKGCTLAYGDYIQFLNSGDTLYDLDVLTNIDRYITSDKFARQVYYGDIVYTYPTGDKVERKYGQFCQTRFYYLLGDCINHQAIFAQRMMLIDNPFDWKNYKYCADRDWMLRIKNNGARFVSTNIMICNYSLDENSQSIANEDMCWKEAESIIKKRLNRLYFVYWFVDKVRFGPGKKLLHWVYKIFFIRNVK